MGTGSCRKRRGGLASGSMYVCVHVCVCVGMCPGVVGGAEGGKAPGSARLRNVGETGGEADRAQGGTSSSGEFRGVPGGPRPPYLLILLSVSLMCGNFSRNVSFMSFLRSEGFTYSITVVCNAGQGAGARPPQGRLPPARPARVEGRASPVAPGR